MCGCPHIWAAELGVWVKVKVVLLALGAFSRAREAFPVIQPGAPDPSAPDHTDLSSPWEPGLCVRRMWLSRAAEWKVKWLFFCTEVVLQNKRQLA